ncbi:MAG TPA: tetratricopeptide repeat protein, partial [Methylomirabilota bacterium]|nr:tetratricopeptide repeat protein [Methylomirabilota bacterium]
MLALLACGLAWPALAEDRPAAPSHLEEGAAAFDRGAFATAIESWSRAARASEQAGDHGGHVSALVHLGEAYGALGRYRQAVTVLDRALRVAEASGQRAQVARVLARLGNVLIATGPPETAEAMLRRAVDMARESADVALGAAALNDL